MGGRGVALYRQIWQGHAHLFYITQRQRDTHDTDKFINQLLIRYTETYTHCQNTHTHTHTHKCSRTGGAGRPRSLALAQPITETKYHLLLLSRQFHVASGWPAATEQEIGYQEFPWGLYVYMHICACVYMHICVCVHMHICVWSCICMHMRICVCVHMYISCVCVYMHILYESACVTFLYSPR